ncbi:MAG: hypothetical protein ACE5HN_03035 [Nitrospiria bacterium]
MELRRKERRKIARGYGPDRRVMDLPPVGFELRRGEQRKRDRRQIDRRKVTALPFFFSIQDRLSERNED